MRPKIADRSTLVHFLADSLGDRGPKPRGHACVVAVA
jgi:hypothetical protein